MSLKEKPEARTRVPNIGDLVFVQGRPGVLFQVDAVYLIVGLAGLLPITRTETGYKEWVVPWSALTFPHPKWWYYVRDFGQLAGVILPIVMLVALLWVLIRVGAGPYLLVGARCSRHGSGQSVPGGHKRIRKRLHRLST